jgi:hypothetical protein
VTLNDQCNLKASHKYCGITTQRGKLRVHLKLMVDLKEVKKSLNLSCSSHPFSLFFSCTLLPPRLLGKCSFSNITWDMFTHCGVLQQQMRTNTKLAVSTTVSDNHCSCHYAARAGMVGITLALTLGGRPASVHGTLVAPSPSFSSSSQV